MAEHTTGRQAHRFWQRTLIPQAAAIAAVAAVVAWLAQNTVFNLAERGIAVGFDFLGRAARFPIAESVIDYSPTDTFGWAVLVGLTNTLFISALVIVLSTVLGFFIALARRSANPLARGLSIGFIDAIRNTPLVVQLLFWYGVVTFGLPPSAEAISPVAGVYLTDRGLYLPYLLLEGQPGAFIAVVLAGLLAIPVAARLARRERERTGRRRRYAAMAGAIALAAALLAWIAGDLSIRAEYAELGRFNFIGGIILSPEFVAVLVGLTLYSTAFAAEIIRGGIDAVPRGQWEAGRAIGLTEGKTLRLVIAPQALRVIVPPMTSQYINVVKNSTLALVVGYPELNFVTATIINQTGQAIEGVLILVAVFLSISLAASLAMNWYNHRLARAER